MNGFINEFVVIVNKEIIGRVLGMILILFIIFVVVMYMIGS